jgi:hypothetical protein
MLWRNEDVQAENGLLERRVREGDAVEGVVCRDRETDPGY